MTVTIARLGNKPIIHSELDETLGDNINGPSLIRVPVWVEDPLGRYYLYFAHHTGRHIRMAYADDLAGPWTVHRPGVLNVVGSGFVEVDPPEPPFDEWPDWAKQSGGRYLYAHVASPDVHVDFQAQQINMYFHGLLPDGSQSTRLAVSPDGLDFQACESLLGPSYFRVFRHGSWTYALAWGGELYRSRSGVELFERGPDVFERAPVASDGAIMRHSAVLVRGDLLHVFYSRIGDEPEVLLHTKVRLSDDWRDWQAGAPEMVLSPELDWEGAGLPVTRSRPGACGPEHALRDPCIYVEGDETWLLYCGAGETAIGLARLVSF